MMFWVSFIGGMIIGAALAIVVMGLCLSSAKSERNAELIGKKN